MTEPLQGLLTFQHGLDSGKSIITGHARYIQVLSLRAWPSMPHVFLTSPTVKLDAMSCRMSTPVCDPDDCKPVTLQPLTVRCYHE